MITVKMTMIFMTIFKFSFSSHLFSLCYHHYYYSFVCPTTDYSSGKISHFSSSLEFSPILHWKYNVGAWGIILDSLNRPFYAVVESLISKGDNFHSIWVLWKKVMIWTKFEGRKWKKVTLHNSNKRKCLMLNKGETFSAAACDTSSNRVEEAHYAQALAKSGLFFLSGLKYKCRLYWL